MSGPAIGARFFESQIRRRASPSSNTRAHAQLNLRFRHHGVPAPTTMRQRRAATKAAAIMRRIGLDLRWESGELFLRKENISWASRSAPSSVIARFLASAVAAILPGRIDRPCRRQNEDMVLLAHIRSAYALSNATYYQSDARRSPITTAALPANSFAICLPRLGLPRRTV
jgi:hypothetical protein